MREAPVVTPSRNGVYSIDLGSDPSEVCYINFHSNNIVCPADTQLLSVGGDGSAFGGELQFKSLKSTFFSDIISYGAVQAQGIACRAGSTGSVTGSLYNYRWRADMWTCEMYIDNTLIGPVSIDYNISDRRVKKINGSMPPVLDRLCTLEMIVYDFVSTMSVPVQRGKKHYGIMSQELENAFSDTDLSVVSETMQDILETDPTRKQRLSKDIHMLLLKAIQELNQKITTIEDRLSRIESVLL